MTIDTAFLGGSISIGSLIQVGATWVIIRATANNAGRTQCSVFPNIPATPAGTPVFYPAWNKVDESGAVGATIVQVDSTAGFVANQWVLVGDPATNNCTAGLVHAVLGPNQIRISGPLNALAVGDRIHAGPNDYANRFDGTSAATPYCAGIGALVLTAKPTLTWLEVKDILSQSAFKVDAGTMGFVANPITGSNAQEQSNGYGPVGIGAWKDALGNPVMLGGGTIDPVGILDGLTVAALQHATTITVANGANFAVGQAIEIGGGAIRDYSSIQHINGDILTIEPLRIPHPIGSAVQGGRVPAVSDWYGAGRLDPVNAVLKAMGYSHDQRDLMIRNYLSDDGIVATDPAVNPILSPDIFLTNANNISEPTPVYTGAGLNDIRAKEYFSGAAPIDFVVEIDGIAPDTFKWSSDGGLTFPNTLVPIIANADHVLSNGVVVTFAANFGHTLADRWDIRGPGLDYNVAGPHQVPANGISAPINTGAGLNDIRVRGYFSGAIPINYVVEIDGTAPDTFKWSSDGGLTFPITLVPIVANADHILSNGVIITFAANLGHTLADMWTIVTAPADHFIHVRVRNRGIDFPSLDGTFVRFYVAMTNGDFIGNGKTPFYFPAGWNDSWPITGNISTNDQESTIYLVPNPAATNPNNIGARLPNDTPIINPIAPNADVTLSCLWSSNDLPPVDTNLKIFLLAEVLPHDGVLDGLSPDMNNNISYREIFFGKADFFDGAGNGGQLTYLEVDNLGTVITQNFKANFKANIGKFTTENLEFVLTRLDLTNAVTTATYRYNGAAWGFVGAAPAWATLNPPTLTGTVAAAAGKQVEVTFSGSFDATNAFARMNLAIQVKGVHNALIFEDSKSVPIYPEASLAKQSYSSPDAAKLAPKSHFFSLANLLSPQLATKQYGTISITEYRVTNLFKANSAVNPPAYAITRGKIFVQRIPGNDFVVNLVLRPIDQPMLGFTPIKYIVYRGLVLTEILKGITAAEQILVAQPGSASDWIKRLWPIHDAQNPGQPFESKAIGFDPGIQNPTDKLDSFFYSINSAFELPMAKAGELLGHFRSDNGGAEFGIDIVLEEGRLDLDLAYVQKLEHKMDISTMPATTPAEIVAILHKREEILHFLDMAAFLGMHIDDDAILTIDDGTGVKSVKQKANIYADILSLFATKNTVYIDVRNENDQSYNIHGAYTDGTTDKSIEIGKSPGTLVNSAYYTTEWPLLSNVDTGSANANSKNAIYLRFRLDYNHKPILYVEHGEILGGAGNGRFVTGNKLFTPGDAKTKIVGFGFPNADVGGGNKANVAWMLKLHYNLRIDAANTPFPPEVPATETYLDNLFGPLDMKIQWAGTQKFAWVTAQEKKFMDGETAIGAAHTVDRGLASSAAGRKLFFMAVKDSLTNASQYFVPQKGISGGTSQRDTFFTEPLLFDGLQLVYDVLDDGGTVKTLHLDTDPDQKRPPEGMLLLGITDAQFTALDGLAGFLDKFPRTVYFESLAGSPFLDPNGISYQKYRLGVRGIDPVGDAKTDFPAAAIYVYSVDSLSFFSADFTNVEPLPLTYVRNYEESIGALKRMPRSFIVAAADPSIRTFTIAAIDLTKEIVKGDRITIKNSKDNDGAYDVDTVNYSTDTVIKVIQAIPSTNPLLGFLHETEKDWEKFFTEWDHDFSGIFDPIRTIVEDFIASIAAIGNTPAAGAALELPIDLYGFRLLERARELAQDNTHAYADDRPLYWARIRMTVALKSHDFCKSSLTERNRLVKRLEKVTRGYETATFINAPAGAKKILISGFDPFHLDPHNGSENTYQSNPSGAAVLALHGQTLDDGLGNKAYIQTVIFPVRYSDFDQNGGTGVVESFFTKFMDGVIASEKADMVFTMSQGGPFQFWVDRFASRYRGGGKDNANRPVTQPPAFRFPDSVIGDQFYKTMLPVGKIVPLMNSGKWKIFFNQNFRYEYKNGAVLKDAHLDLDAAYPKRGNASMVDGFDLVENVAHPKHTKLFGKVPSDLSSATNPKKENITAKDGSGGDYLSNEIYYRVSLLRNTLDINLPTGHYHLPLMQIGPDFVFLINEWYSLVAPNQVKIAFNPDLTKEMIDVIQASILKAIAP